MNNCHKFQHEIDIKTSLMQRLIFVLVSLTDTICPFGTLNARIMKIAPQPNPIVRLCTNVILL